MLYLLTIILNLSSSVKLQLKAVKQYSFTDGNVFGGWAWIKGFHDRNDDDGFFLTTTFTSGFIIEDLWGENLLKIEREWTEWGSVDSHLLNGIPNGGTGWVNIGCNNQWCGPMVSDKNFEPVVKVGSASWTNKLVIKINGHEVDINKLADNAWHKTSPKTHTYNYKPEFNLNCKGVKKLERKDTHKILALKGNIKSITEVTIEESATLSSESATSSEWFLEAAVNGGNKIGLEIPVEGAKLGVEQTLGWSVKGSTKYTTTDKSSTTLNYKLTTKKSVEQSCELNDNLYLVTRHECVEFNINECKAVGIVERYETYKFDSVIMRSCHTNQFTACAKDDNDLNERLKIAKLDTNRGSTVLAHNNMNNNLSNRSGKKHTFAVIS